MPSNMEISRQDLRADFEQARRAEAAHFGSGYPASPASSDGDHYSPEAASINGSSMEAVVQGTRVVSAGRDMMKHDGAGFRDQGALGVKNRVWEEIANKLLPPEQSEQMVKRLEKRADERIRRTYVEGNPLASVDDSAPVPRIGLNFLPGADKPQVTRLEQTGMTGDEPDQKEALWRVNTAATLLMQFEVSSDLSIVNRYKRAQNKIVLNRARSRKHQSSLSLGPESPLEPLSDSPRSSLNRNLTNLSLASRSTETSHLDAVTIDSSSVFIVNELRPDEWDMEATLIEVDGSSILNLMVNYRHLISRGGPDMSFEETRDLLETMIEDARRLCVRSPVLFRMSTRSKIINSRDTRFGINHGEMFRTLTTSQGIKEIISLSAAYFNSLDTTGTDNHVQKFIRPRFLQMIVLLLSLLNDNDLDDIADFLESTYKLKAERSHLELLFLKVIPLMSINAKVFLHSMVPTFEGFPLSKEHDANLSHIWNVFVERILQKGYILPGTIADLGRETGSWLVKWPEHGFKSTAVFNDLQYAGCPNRTINEIPPIEFHPENSLDEVTVIMTSGKKYTIGSVDLERITCLTPGAYSLVEAADNGRNYDLVITEVQLNAELYEAIRKTNEIVGRINLWISQVQKKSLKHILRRPQSEMTFLHECKGSGRVTKSTASLNQDILAVAYKVEGRKITTRDSMRTMLNDIREMRIVIDQISRKTNDVGNTQEKQNFRVALDTVRQHIAEAELRRIEVGNAPVLSDEPISKVLYPGGVDPKSALPIWNDYQAWYRMSEKLLTVDAKRSMVTSVKWLSEKDIETTIQGISAKYFLCPLQPVEEGHRDDEIREGDVVMLIGQYLVIAELPDDDYTGGPNQEYLMTNYLRITSVEEINSTRRGRNRARQPEMVVQSFFR